MPRANFWAQWGMFGSRAVPSVFVLASIAVAAVAFSSPIVIAKAGSTEPWLDPLALERTEAALDPAHQPAPHIAGVRLGEADVDARGARVARDGATVSIGLASLGRGDTRRAVASPAPEVDGPEVRIVRAAGVVEWWRSLPSGLEQGVTLDARPAGDGALQLDMSVGEGVVPKRIDDDAIALTDASGRELARYAHLAVVDARGRRIPARMLVAGGHIRLEVDDHSAQYPIVVDPLLEFVELPQINSTIPREGTAVAISAAGGWAIVGGSNLVRVYFRAGDVWTPVDHHPSVPDGSRFGASVAISSNGQYVAIGDPGYNGNQGRVLFFSRHSIGGVWRYRDFFAAVPSPGLDGGSLFGTAVALSDDGLHLVATASNDIVAGASSGTARYYTCVPPTSCTQRAEFAPPSPTGRSGDDFGASVAINADASMIAVGAPGDNGERGHVYVHTRSGSTWTYRARLSAPSAQAGEHFGTSVATDGTRLLVGAANFDATADSRDDHGRVISFEWTGSTFASAAEVSRGGHNARLGFSLAMARHTGRRAVAGAYTDGYIRFLSRAGSTWTVGGNATLPATSHFGFSVSMSGDGTRALGGAPNEGTVRSYRLWDAQGEPCTGGGDCRNGLCVDGVCCNDACNDACEACSTAAGSAGASGTCSALTAGAAAAITCRAAAPGGCDVAEQCVAGDRSCPTNLFSTEVCRPADGPCDAPERCSGAAMCPPDIAVAAGTTCRGIVGDTGCDLEDVCDGTSSECADRVHPEGTNCGVAAGPCDDNDLCDDAGVCVENVLPAGTVCNAGVLDVCDTADMCNGLTIDCPMLYLADVMCRAADGTCDTPEFCSGDAPGCPPDAVESAGMSCRESTDASCDPSEQCDGVGAACPADVNSCGVEADAGGGEDDAGGGEDDAGVGSDAGEPVAAAGCGCRAPGTGGGLPLALFALTAWFVRRRR